HALIVGERLVFDVVRVAEGLDPADELRERIADPRNHHGPALDTAHPVDPLLEGDERQQLLDVVDPGLRDRALDPDTPWPRLQAMGMGRRIALARAELVEVVVAGDVLVGRARLVDRERAGARIERGPRRRPGAGGPRR